MLAIVIALWPKFPRTALGATLFLALLGDIKTISWFPFAKNFSSRESIMYLHDSASFSPLELSFAAGLVAVVWRNMNTIGRLLKPTPLTRPMAVFAAFCLFGFAVGLSRGGDFRVALFEIRPMLYLPIAYLLFANVCTTRRDYARLFAAAMTAIVIQSLLSLEFLLRLDQIDRSEVESLIEHGSAIGMNLVMIVIVLLALTPRTPRWMTWALTFSLIPVGWVYIVSQRRAAIVALGGAFALVALHLWWRQRSLFWKIIPLATILVIGYVGAFWNVESGAGFPAQAVKGVVAPEQASAADASSDLYREIEKFDLWATIRADPLAGQGFGKPFLRPLPLPDISSFEFNAYIPHNSLLWVWIKTGVGGFVALLYLFARSMTLGTDRYRKMERNLDMVVALTMITFIVMFAIFLFVDIAWEARNVLLLAMAFGLSTGTFAVPGVTTRPDPPGGGKRTHDRDDENLGDTELRVVVAERSVS